MYAHVTSWSFTGDSVVPSVLACMNARFWEEREEGYPADLELHRADVNTACTTTAPIGVRSIFKNRKFLDCLHTIS